MKFRPNDKVNIKVTDNDVFIEIGPVIDRENRVWRYYQAFITREDTQKLINAKQNVSSRPYFYREIKDMIKIREVKALKDKDSQLSRDDIMEDLGFIQDELLKCEQIMNLWKERNVAEKFGFYYNLIFNETHKMFGFSSKEVYDKYLDEIERISNEIYKKEASKFAKVSRDVWGDEEDNEENEEEDNNVQNNQRASVMTQQSC